WPAPSGGRAALADAGVPPPDPARAPAARPPGGPGRGRRDRRRRGGRDRPRLVWPTPQGPPSEPAGLPNSTGLLNRASPLLAVTQSLSCHTIAERSGAGRATGVERESGPAGPAHSHRAPTRDQPREARSSGAVRAADND